MRGRALRSTMALAGIVLALVLGAQSAAAATVVSSSGSFGMHVFKDSMTHPGISCYYGNVSGSDGRQQALWKIVINGPKVWAKNRTSGVDSQWVGWRYVVQHSQAGGAPPWKSYTTSSWVKAVSHDNAGVQFSSRTWTAPANKNWQWHVEIVMHWYKPGSSSTVSGSVTLMDQYDVTVFPPNANVNNTAPCLPGQ